MDSTDSGHAYTDEPSFFDANLMLSTSSDAYDAYAPLSWSWCLVDSERKDNTDFLDAMARMLKKMLTVHVLLYLAQSWHSEAVLRGARAPLACLRL